MKNIFGLSIFVLFSIIVNSRVGEAAFDYDYGFEPELDYLAESDYQVSSESAESPIPSSGRSFHVTDYGAVGDGEEESSSAFQAAWEAACFHEDYATFVIPDGTFLLGPITFSGPCLNNQSPMVEISGTLKAPSSPEAFSSDWIVFKGLQGLKIMGAKEEARLDGQGSETWSKATCHHKQKNCKNFATTLKFQNVSHATVRNVNLINSKNFHFVIHNSDNINVSGFNIQAPEKSPNTDGIHVSYSTNVSITSSTIGVGDDCVSIGPGNINISVSEVYCGPGHGISVGSLGREENERDVVGVHVWNCTIKGTQNGLRVKTWPGSPPSNASNLVFEDIVMINVSNPIIVDQEYCPSNTCKTNKPSGVKLNHILFKNVRGTYRSDFAVILLCSSAVPCENIYVVDVNLNQIENDDDDNDDSHEDDNDDDQVNHFVANGGIHGLEVLNSRF